MKTRFQKTASQTGLQKLISAKEQSKQKEEMKEAQMIGKACKNGSRKNG